MDPYLRCLRWRGRVNGGWSLGIKWVGHPSSSGSVTLQVSSVKIVLKF